MIQSRQSSVFSSGEARAVALLEAAPTGIFECDVEGIIQSANAAAERIIGYSRSELIGTHFLARIESAQRREELMAYFLRCQADALPFRPELCRTRRKDGRTIYIEWNCAHWRDGEGRAAGLVMAFSDITLRLEAEAALREANRAMEIHRHERQTLKLMLESSDHDRQLIAYEIHDGLAQHLAGAIMQLETYHHLCDKKPRLAKKSYDLAIGMMQQAHFEARRLINGVRPPILDDEGILPALAHLVAEVQRQEGPKVDFRSRVTFDRLAPPMENAIYRIVQESLNNAYKHSQASLVRVELSQRGPLVRIRIQDDGVGFVAQEVGMDHFGLRGIQERTRLLGGEFNLQTGEGKGTRISVEFPLRSDD